MWFALFTIVLGIALGLGFGAIILENSEEFRSPRPDPHVR